MEKNIVDEIIQIKDVLPRKQRILCNYLVLNYVDAGIMTVAELAEKSGVGTTTVMRLVKTLHYDNYGDFRKAFLNISLNRSSTSYMDVKKSFQNPSGISNYDTLHILWNDMSHTVVNLINPKNTEQLNRAVELMLKAGHINLLGLRSSRTAAIYLETMIDRFYPRTKQLSNDAEFLYDRILRLSEDDIVLIISAWPCTKKTVDVAEICHSKKIPIILITNTSLNPIARYADAVIDTNSVNCGCGILPIMFVAEALVEELGRRLGPESTRSLDELEAELEQYDVFAR